MKCALFMLAVGFSLPSLAGAAAYSKVVCNDASGNSLFSGLALLPNQAGEGKFSRELSLSYTARIPVKASLSLDRATLKRYSNREFPDCHGPYAQVFEKDEKTGTLRCASGSVDTPRDASDTEEGLLHELGLSAEEASCAMITTKASVATGSFGKGR